ncbi:dnaj homolog subfamily b member 1 [Lynx pardinus]|uniref:Dnaj homolog subfamily b member 1 n=1 Tax=Lynx pardinus TaxID=191816 RepID=A0A485NDT2_LYNPA|nr:dnaj homolog subfamily b member 1 [Lynx pardinus]
MSEGSFDLGSGGTQGHLDDETLALCGCTVNVPTLDGRTIPVVFKDVIRPGMRRKVPGEGLPLPKTPEKRGDLIIEFEVIFPERIPQTSRTVLEQVLPI